MEPANCHCPTPPVLYALGVLCVILLIVASAVAWMRWGRSGGGRKDSFTAHQVYTASQALFERTGGAATYSEYKILLPDADSVVYTDVRNLWRKGQLSPATVAAVL